MEVWGVEVGAVMEVAGAANVGCATVTVTLCTEEPQVRVKVEV